MARRQRPRPLPTQAAARIRATPQPARLFDELADVTLAAPIHVTGLDRDLPAGSHGTVVGVWRDGEAYEVEFSEPFECLVTVPAEGLRA